jgi:hypothetical protein
MKTFFILTSGLIFLSSCQTNNESYRYQTNSSAAVSARERGLSPGRNSSRYEHPRKDYPETYHTWRKRGLDSNYTRDFQPSDRRDLRSRSGY